MPTIGYVFLFLLLFLFVIFFLFIILRFLKLEELYDEVKKLKGKKPHFLNDKKIILRDGYEIDYKIFHSKVTDVFVIATHGMKSEKADYDQLINFCQLHNISIISYDRRGSGKNKTWKLKSLQTAIEDLCDIVKIVKKRYSGKKIILYGESLGSVLSTFAIATNKIKVDGLVTSNIPTRKFPIELSFPLVIYTFFAFFFSPYYVFERLYLETSSVSNNKTYIDHFLKRKGVSDLLTLPFLLQSKKLSLSTFTKLSKLSLPILIFQSGDDIFSNLKTTNKYNKLFKKDKNKTWYYFENAKHALLNEKDYNLVAFNHFKKWLQQIIKISNLN